MLLCVYSIQGFSAIESKIAFSVKALFKDRAMIEINGEQRLLSAGEESPEGVKLLSSDANEANILCHGNEYTLYINQTAYSGFPEKDNNSNFRLPRVMVPGKNIHFTKQSFNGVTKYVLKNERSMPSIVEYGQDAVWVGIERKLYRFDVKKEAWGLFDLSDSMSYKINKLSVSDKSVILNGTKMIDNKNRSGLYMLDMRTSKLHYQLDTNPSSFQFIDEELWFLDSSKGLGHITPKLNNSNVSYKDALLFQEKKEDKGENKVKDKGKTKKTKKTKSAYLLSTNGDDIWYSHHSKFSSGDESGRLNEVCVSHYNKRRRTFEMFTRKDMGLDSKYNCVDIAISDDQVWVSHGDRYAGLSVLNTTTNKWRRILASTNNMMIGGNKIILDNNRLFMIVSNQLIVLNTRTLHADVVWGNAADTSYWRSSFYVKNGHAWFVTLERSNKKQKIYMLVLYKIPVNYDTARTNATS